MIHTWYKFYVRWGLRRIVGLGAEGNSQVGAEGNDERGVGGIQVGGAQENSRVGAEGNRDRLGLRRTVSWELRGIVR